MNLLMRRLRAGSFAWLVVHELRLAARSRRRSRRGAWVALVLLAIFTWIGIMTAYGLRNVPIEGGPAIFTGALAASILLMSFMTTQALLRSQHTLYESGDLDLLMSAPLEPRTILLAKLCGIAGSVVISFFLLVLPVAVPVAVLGHPGLFGIPVLLAALSLASACLGLAIMVGVVALAGPRAARTLGQIIGALLAGAVFLFSQLLSNGGGGGRRSGAVSLFGWLRDHGIGAGGIGALPGRAALGDPGAAALLLGGAILVFAVTGYLFGRTFLSSYQKARMRLTRTRAATGPVARQFRTGLFATMFAKEWRLLARDPALAFQIVLRLIYLAPMAIAALGPGRAPLLPALAFASVLIAGQLVGSFAWLAVSAEDAPDLLTVAPIARKQVERAKLVSAMAMAAPLGLILPVAVALHSPLGALTTIVMTAAGGAVAGLIEIRWQKPAPRKTFRRRRSGSIVAGILTLLATAFFGGLAALAVWAIG